MDIEFCGDICVASGKGWRYEKIGDISVFTQTGRVESLRVVKTTLKLYIKMRKSAVSLNRELNSNKEGT